ncbi:hypothetical protein Tco_0057584 [Tanacetum coccineum]
MTRSSKKEIVEPYEEPERVLHSIRKLFKTQSLDYSSSPEFDLFFDHESQGEEEITETMGEPTMKEYIKKTRDDYGSGILNQNLMRKLDANEHIERVLEIADLFTLPDVTQDQLMLRIFLISLTGAASRWIRNEPAGLITT